MIEVEDALGVPAAERAGPLEVVADEREQLEDVAVRENLDVDDQAPAELLVGVPEQLGAHRRERDGVRRSGGLSVAVVLAVGDEVGDVAAVGEG